jgi:hypothetical protein
METFGWPPDWAAVWITSLTVCVFPFGNVTESPMPGTAKKSQGCSVSIDMWPRYTVQEIVM